MQFGYGKSRLTLCAQGDLLSPRGARGAASSDAIAEALRNPIGTRPLAGIVRRGERVAIVVNDITRLTRTDLMLPPILETLNAAGVPDSDIIIVFALGNHRPQTDDERRLILGGEIYSRIRSFDHDASDGSALIEIGTTRFGNRVEINRHVWEADRIVLTGEIVYHLIAGYSGGRKSLVPGVAGFRTITFNHSMIFDPNCRSGKLDGNPAHEDLLEACSMAEPDFMLNVVLSPGGELIRAVAGHFDLAHREGCRTVDEMLSVSIGAEYDLIAASAGGFPLDIDLRQAHKGLENACRALRPGGSILFFAECGGGAGIRSFEEYVYRYADEHEMREALGREFVVGGHKAYWVARLGRMFDIHLASRLDPAFVRRCHFTPVCDENYEAAWRELTARAGPNARVGLIPDAGFTLPVRVEKRV